MNKINDPLGTLSREGITSDFDSALRMALSAFPLYGGAPEDSESSSGESTDSQSTASGSGDQSGNDTSTVPGGGSVQQDQMDPQQIADLLKQVQALTAQNKQLQTENGTFKSQQEKKQREEMGREQALEQDLQNALTTVEKLDRALKNQAILNAINGFQDVQFHDPQFVLHELSQDIFENMEVDLENATVTVSGIENDLRRIAKEKSWAVKKAAQQNDDGQNPYPPRPRGSGAPPPPSGSAGQRQSRRQALVDKYPVIAHGRAAIR